MELNLKLCYFKDCNFFRVKPRIEKIDEKFFRVYIKDKEINRNNFDELCDIILEIINGNKIKIEKPPKFKDERHKKLYEAFRDYEKRDADKKSVSYATIISIVMNGGNGYVSKEAINKMTIYQLMNRYNFIIEKDGCDRNFQQLLAGADPKNLELTYWVLKINKLLKNNKGES